MKTRLGVLICLFFVGMILGAIQPTLLHAGAETGGGTPWDQFVDPKPYPIIHLEGPLSIYYDIHPDDLILCGDGSPLATMYYTVRLSKHGKLYTFQGSSDCCLADILGQGNEIKNNFLGTVVVPGIFGNNFKSWKLKSIDNAQFNDQTDYPYSKAFVADIEIAVKTVKK